MASPESNSAALEALALTAVLMLATRLTLPVLAYVALVALMALPMTGLLAWFSRGDRPRFDDEPEDGAWLDDEPGAHGVPERLPRPLRPPGLDPHSVRERVDRDVEGQLLGVVGMHAAPAIAGVVHREPTAQAFLAQHGHEGLELTDNGAVRRRSPALADLPHVHAYHLRPRGVSKANAVAAHRRMRGYAAEDCIAIGDSREDLAVATVVGSFFLVANALERDEGLRSVAGNHHNVRVTEAAHGAGVYEAVVGMLAERR